ncbi:bifunctional Delta(1)-pyrroline-2-carboxylate/Delta(1)-piperideine-2-carboxylate reductase [Algoriphagus machipongonensis]|uniref:Ornithine cyclodeaminase n=1 Tax=Algoriphagus machipongonensis TaxID=388413 RepID=A3I2L0_9BACT|nr:ornithine cyclodeaminase family protein [Algoriphagus machipongonensis]EAZ79314.1 putative ornithine cyclodeaminase [Algoriphagus machipongonensis]
MQIIPEDKISTLLDYKKLIEELREIFKSDYTMPVRHHHFYKTEDGEENTLILMPVWNNEYMGMKQVTVAPTNAKNNMPSIFAQYILSNSKTGQPLAMMNATELTARRTACASALASSYLSRKDAENLLIVGGGSVANHLVQAHMSVRNFKKISVWMRNQEKMEAFVNNLKDQGIPAESVSNLEESARNADIISCATLSKDPIIKGEWVKLGAHLDMIGSHKPTTRETDNDAIRKSSIFLDSREGALHESGELAIPIAEGIITENDIKADIVELVKGIHPGRSSNDEITLFKSAGLAVEDLAAALLIYKSYNA